VEDRSSNASASMSFASDCSFIRFQGDAAEPNVLRNE
jgi:hypothetical protein